MRRRTDPLPPSAALPLCEGENTRILLLAEGEPRA